MNDYGQLSATYREDYRRRLTCLRRRMSKQYQEDPVRCIFEEVRTSAVWLLNQPSKDTQCLEQYELDALLLFRRTIREGKCQT